MGGTRGGGVEDMKFLRGIKERACQNSKGQLKKKKEFPAMIKKK